MPEGGQIEFSLQFTIHTGQHIEVERGGNPQRVVIGRQKLRSRLFEIRAKQ